MKPWLKRLYMGTKPLPFFVVAAATFGMAFLLITPPFQGADETAHFLRAYQVSTGHLVSTKTHDGKVGGYLPSDISKMLQITDTGHIEFHPQLKYGEGLTKAALEMGHSDKYSFYDFTASAPYPPTAYPVSSFGIAISRLLRLPTMVSLYAGRLGNLLTWIALIGAAIYFMPSRKWAMVAVGLLPMALFQAATLNGDVMTFGTLALLLALILKFRSDGTKISTPYGALIIVLATLMVLSKQIMFVFLPLALLLRKDNFSSLWHSRIFKIALVVVPLLTFGAWMMAIHGISETASFSNGQNPAKQMHYIMFKPWSYLNVLWNTYFYVWGDNVTRSLIGTFGWADTPLSELIVTVGYIGLFLLMVGSYETRFKELLSKWDKRLLLFVAAMYLLAVSTALYVYYSPVAFRIVYGLQGRYYIPLVVLAIPLLRSRNINIEPRLYKRIAVFLPLTLLVASTITLFVRYFVHNV